MVSPRSYGKFTKAITVTSGSSFIATGSFEGVLGVVSTGTDYTLELEKGGLLPGAFLDAGIIHEIGIRTVTNVTTPVTLLYKV
jgi:hypothetical protein